MYCFNVNFTGLLIRMYHFKNNDFCLVDYISSVGGLFGLFLGFSLLSFLEIVYWLGLNLIRNLFQPNKQTAAT